MAGKDLRYGVLLLALISMAYRTHAEAVTATNCTTDVNCTADNSVCDTAADLNKCKCSENYIQNPADETACIQVLGMSCESDSTVCDGVTNSECGTDKTCGCAINYEAKDVACLKAAGQTCTTNAECASDKCEGEEGTKKCAEGNSAQTVVVSAVTITLSLLLLAFQRIF